MPHAYGYSIINIPRKLETENDKKLQDLQRQLDHVQRAAEGDADRIRRRTDAEIAELKSILARTQDEMEKVNAQQSSLISSLYEKKLTKKSGQERSCCGG